MRPNKKFLSWIQQRNREAHSRLKMLFEAISRPVRKYRTILGVIKARVWEFKVVSSENKKISYLKQKKKVNVSFVIIHESTWKTDRLFDLLAQDPSFLPSVIIAPDTIRTPEWAEAEMQRCAAYFESKGIRHYCASLDDAANTRLVASISPDVVILNNPHDLTCRALRNDLVAERLACYIPYHMEVSRYNNDEDQYNQPFHNAIWKIFSPHISSLEAFRKVARRKGKNVVVTGYPGVEDLVMQQSDIVIDPWKPLGLKRLIWAPHHTIDMPNLPYANFLRYAEHFRDLVDSHAERVQWCFKPHPLLKPKLIEHPDWGPERTEEYFRFWENHPVTQLELGKYIGLFRNSDAMIHDSGSFLAEYLYVNKPVMYLWSSSEVVKYFNAFGRDALASCERGDNEADIHRFIASVLSEDDRCSDQRQAFLTKHPVSINGELPSNRILKEIKSAS